MAAEKFSNCEYKSMAVLPNREQRQRLLQHWEHASNLPLLALAAAMVPLLLLPLLVNLPAGLEEIFVALEWFIWAIFALDLAVRVALTDNRPRYLLTHWYDVLIVALPVLRPLRILRVLFFGTRAVVTARQTLQIRFLVLFAIAAVLISAGLVVAFESKAEGSSIKSLTDGLWWAAVTITTVGYGDKYPVTPEGRGVAVFLMFGGIALFSALAANLAALLMGTSSSSSVEKQLEDISQRLERLERTLQEKK